VLLGRPIALDVPSLSAKIVDGRRGGYCFEQNTLFGAVLESLGFHVTPLAGRVRLGATEVRPAHAAISTCGSRPARASPARNSEAILSPSRFDFPGGLMRLPSFALAAGFLGAVLPAAAEVTDCTVVPSVPFEITTQGVHCLKSDFDTALASGVAITVRANNVTLDMNGHKLGNLAAGPGTQAVGISVAGSNVTVRNGRVRGYAVGVSLGNVQGGVVEDLRIDSCWQRGILAAGGAHLIQRNFVLNTGGTTDAQATAITGIAVSSSNTTVADNQVWKTVSAGALPALGIQAQASSVLNNRVYFTHANGSGRSAGIELVSDAIADGNHVIGAQPEADAIRGGADTVCVNNRAVKYAFVITGCADGGGNVGTSPASRPEAAYGHEPGPVRP
jgi:hypothetical protein